MYAGNWYKPLKRLTVDFLLFLKLAMEIDL